MASFTLLATLRPRFLTTAAAGLKRCQTQRAMLLAVAILEEGLRASLNKEIGGQLAEDLDALYEYCSNRLIEANLNNKPELLNEVVKLLEPLRDAWETIGQPSYSPDAPPPEAKAAVADESTPAKRDAPSSYGHV